MPTVLHRSYPPDWPGYPPHMAREDFAIWKRWYPTVDPRPIELYFDVGLGEGREPLDTATPDERELWRHLTQKRADALLVFPDRVHLVELRHAATPNAIGRLLVYRRLLHDDNPFGTPITTELVTDQLDPDLPAIARATRITYTVI